ncbi:MAG: tetrahydrofolate dehydrogenase/cyclohydrolase catalytic domain-containing protein [Candidatus Hadarchaeales archaeon]
MAVLMDGKTLAEEIKAELRGKVVELKRKGIVPTLATFLVGDHPASKIYVEGKRKDCEEVGISFRLYTFPPTVEEEELKELLHRLNGERGVHGIFIQLPLPSHLNSARLVEEISPQKDVDGLHPYNVGRLWKGQYDPERSLLPCTPKGILKLLDRYGVEVRGKLVTIINRSDLVGKPLAKLLLDRDATVLLCHSKTRDLEGKTREADIVVSAVGRRPSFVLTAEMIKEGAVVVDVGMNYVGGKLMGDVDFEGVSRKASYLTPVPGGVGPMTRVMLLHNTLLASETLGESG